ncbi:MAG: hypothetical protein AOA66_1565 [Candidatus Bathyarchaeota archaeon BA2]|nr:MAG: hypothetical protein AOA66_1565 [Candidatus Bathyarchaeota archaeon BA2]
MGLTILKKKSGYALGLLLIIIGIITLLIVLWKLYNVGAFASLAAFSEKLLEKEFTVLGIGLKLIHYTLLGVVLLVVGGVILIARRERVRVAEEVSVLLECPQCKNHWQEPLSRTHLESMGYPKVRTLSRRKCPKCAKFIRPKIVTTEGGKV